MLLVQIAWIFEIRLNIGNPYLQLIGFSSYKAHKAPTKSTSIEPKGL